MKIFFKLFSTWEKTYHLIGAISVELPKCSLPLYVDSVSVLPLSIRLTLSVLLLNRKFEIFQVALPHLPCLKFCTPYIKHPLYTFGKSEFLARLAARGGRFLQRKTRSFKWMAVKIPFENIVNFSFKFLHS